MTVCTSQPADKSGLHLACVPYQDSDSGMSLNSPAKRMGVHPVGKAMCRLEARVAAARGHQMSLHAGRDLEEGRIHHHAR